MEVREHEPLKEKTTLRIGGFARYFIKTKDLEEAIIFAQEKKLPIFILGGGSNIVLPDGTMPAVVIQPDFTGVEILSEDKKEVCIRVGASENLDTFIQQTVNNGWWGLENLSFVPGSVGGLAIQNMGAYGVEAKDYIREVSAFDTKEGKYVTLTNKDCKFGYRSSIFNTEQKGRYIITDVTLSLSREPKPVLSYRGVKNRIKNNSQQHIRDTITMIRKEKDLDPERVWSVGSFFKNIEKEDVSDLPQEIQEKCFKTEMGYKIPSGALIEHAGLKGFCVGDACVSSTQANMLINKQNASRKDLNQLFKHVCRVVKGKYAIELTHEPEFIAIS